MATTRRHHVPSNGKTTGSRLESSYQAMEIFLDSLPFNVLYADQELKIRYVNPASLRSLKVLEEFLPVHAEEITGQPLDVFYKAPEGQEDVFTDPQKLPHHAVVSIGTELIDLLASAIHDPDGRYLGPMITWNIVTQKTLTERKVRETSQLLTSSSSDLTTISQQMASNATETAAQASAVSAAAEQVSRNIQTVATGAQEMTASSREISKNASEAAQVATSAVKVAETTNKTISKLGESSAEIGQVIKVITSIAQQTNLLALNATIEAARAGEAGRGFAVVANEVKELARETAKATAEISRKIEAIQTDTRGAIRAIGEIGTIINQINDIQNTIASSVEEQTATTNEISRNVAEAARGSSEIAKNITGVAQAAGDTNRGATECERSAVELAHIASELQTLINAAREEAAR